MSIAKFETAHATCPHWVKHSKKTPQVYLDGTLCP